MRRQWLIHVLLWLHLVWAVLLLAAPTALITVTPLAVPIIMFGGPVRAALVYIAVSLWVALAILSDREDQPLRRLYWPRLLACVAQQALAVMTATGAIWVVSQGAWLTGAVSPRARLLSGQAVYVVLVIFHFFAIMEVFAPALVGEVWEKLHSFRWSTRLSRSLSRRWPSLSRISATGEGPKNPPSKS